MNKVTKEEFDYFLGKIDFSKTNLDAKAIEIMNRLGTLFSDEYSMEEINKALHVRDEVYGLLESEDAKTKFSKEDLIADTSAEIFAHWTNKQSKLNIMVVKSDSRYKIYENIIGK
jgi:hypothetical protein